MVSTAQLAEIGYSRSSAAKAARVGRLHRVHRGVYAVGHRRLTWEGRCFAALLACAPAVAFHFSAAWLWGLSRSRPTVYDVSVPSKRRPRAEARIHYATLGEDDVVEVRGIPTTSLARTHLDLGALVDAKRLDRYLQRAGELKDEEGRGSFDLGDFESLLARTRGHHGHAPLSRALRLYRPDLAVTRSELERDFRALVRAHGLPAPAMNHIVGPYEIDAYWEAERFGVELDVFATHGSRLSFEEDRQRADELLALGVEITRFTDVRMEREPGRLAASLAGHLARRRRL